MPLKVQQIGIQAFLHTSPTIKNSSTILRVCEKHLSVLNDPNSTPDFSAHHPAQRHNILNELGTHCAFYLTSFSIATIMSSCYAPTGWPTLALTNCVQDHQTDCPTTDMLYKACGWLGECPCPCLPQHCMHGDRTWWPCLCSTDELCRITPDRAKPGVARFSSSKLQNLYSRARCKIFFRRKHAAWRMLRRDQPDKVLLAHTQVA